MSAEPEITRHTYVLPDIGSWIEIGVSKGWCASPVCSTHDLVEMTDEEDSEFEEGYDPCIHVLRLWEQPHG